MKRAEAMKGFQLIVSATVLKALFLKLAGPIIQRLRLKGYW